MTSSVAGLVTLSVRPLSASHHLPSMYILLSVAVAVAILSSFKDRWRVLFEGAVISSSL